MRREPTLHAAPAFGLARLVALAALACAGASGCHGASADDTREAPAARAEAERAVVPVQVATVEERETPEFLTVTGTLLANHESKVAAGVSGKVLSTHVERGQKVQKGDVLAVLDTRSVSANLAEAQASAESARSQREQAKTDCARSKELFARGAMSQAEFDRAQSQCRTTEAQAEAAEARARSLTVNLGDASAIRAPFAGFVAERSVSAGEYVSAQTVVATVVETDPLRLELSVPESAALEMKPGLPVEFHLAAREDRRFVGTVRYVGPSVRRQSRDLLVEAVVANGDHALIPGMFATARVHQGDPRRPVVPARAVRTDGSLHHLFVVKDGKVEDRIVQLGEPLGAGGGARVAIVDGVKAGERVALDPATLADGLAVQASLAAPPPFVAPEADPPARAEPGKKGGR